MALLMLDQGEEITLTALADLGLTLKLYKNDYTPIDGSTEANFTEADFSGYAAIAFTDSGDWAFTQDAPSYMVAAQQTFQANDTIDPAQNMYGYYVVRTSDGAAIWAERFTNGPYGIAESGDYVKVTPKISIYKSGES